MTHYFAVHSARPILWRIGGNTREETSCIEHVDETQKRLGFGFVERIRRPVGGNFFYRTLARGIILLECPEKERKGEKPNFRL